MKKIVGGRIIDPWSDSDAPGNLWIQGKEIVSEPSDECAQDVEVLDAEGCWIIPGLIDMHVHLRQPGKEDAETIDSGIAAAVAGGVTSMACMPNTNPALDCPELISFVTRESDRVSKTRVHPISAVSRGRRGKELVAVHDVVDAGAVALSDDGSPIASAALLREALKICGELNIPIIDHCEDLSLSGRGAMREGEISRMLNIPGIPSFAEDVLVARDIVVASEVGGHLHLAHLSSAGSVALLRWAQNRGYSVSGEVTPHHLMLTHQSLSEGDANFKMNPPLGTEEDREVLVSAVRDGTISTIASDHAPHTSLAKERGLLNAPFGVLGLETMLSCVITSLIKPGHLTPLQAVATMTKHPAEILRLDSGSLHPGSVADIVVVDPRKSWIVDPDKFRSRSKNTCFAGVELWGVVKYTLIDGKVVFPD